MRAAIPVGLLMAALALLPAAGSQAPTPTEPPPRGYVCYRAVQPPVIDGKLDDAAWADTPWSEEFVDIEGDKKPKPRHRTRMKMLWTDQGLYIGASLDEPNVWATLREHDCVIFQDNDFEVFLDPDGDSHNYGELELNALNTTWDLLLTKPYKDGGRAVNAWEILGLKTAVHIDGTLNDPTDTDRGWSVEIFWPFSGLKELSNATIPPKHGEQWRIGFSRVEWDVTIEQGKTVKVPKKPEYNWIWSAQGVIDMHRPERWGFLQFSTAKTGTDTYQPDPDQPIRDRLHRVYYAQREYHKKHGRYAGFNELSFDFPGLSLESTRSTFEARLNSTTPGSRWVIQHDARIVREKTP